MKRNYRVAKVVEIGPYPLHTHTFFIAIAHYLVYIRKTNNLLKTNP